MEKKTERSFKDLESIIGLSVMKCYRRIFDMYDDLIDQNLQDQELDGDTYIVFSDGKKEKEVFFSANTEDFSVKVFIEFTEDLSQYKDMSSNLFWKSRIGNQITQILPLNSQYRSNPYGVRFVLSNDSYFELVYIHENEYTSDALAIKGS